MIFAGSERKTFFWFKLKITNSVECSELIILTKTKHDIRITGKQAFDDLCRPLNEPPPLEVQHRVQLHLLLARVRACLCVKQITAFYCNCLRHNDTNLPELPACHHKEH